MSTYSSFNRADNEWIIFSFLAAFAVVVCGGLISAYVLTQLWEWFIVPAFDTRSMSFAAAVGIVLVVGLLGGTSSRNRSPENAEPWVYLLLFFMPILNPLLALTFGWLFHQFV